MFDSLALTSFPVTPNGYRVTEMVHQFNGARLIFVSKIAVILDCFFFPFEFAVCNLSHILLFLLFFSRMNGLESTGN